MNLQESLGAPEMSKIRCENPVIYIISPLIYGTCSTLEYYIFFCLKSHFWCWWSEVPRQRNAMFC